MLPKAISLKSRGLSAYIVQLTPELAATLLQSNLHCQRSINRGIVTRLRGDISANRFVINGEPIIISNTGKLIDGQQRCTAVIEAGEAIEVLVIEGLSEDVFKTINSTGGRSLGDTLKIAGYKDEKLFTPALRLIETYLRGELSYERNSQLSHAFLTDRAAFHRPALETSCSLARNDYKTVLLEQSVVAAAHYLFTISDPALTPHFFAELVDKEVATKDEPVWVLRQRLQADLAEKKRMSTQYKFGLAIKAFNAYCSCTKITLLRITDRESWPTIFNLPPQQPMKKKGKRRIRKAA